MAIDKQRIERAAALAQAELGRSVVALNPDWQAEAKTKRNDARIFGVKNTNGIPGHLFERMRQSPDYLWLTVDKMASLGRSVDTDLVNPLTYRPMTGSTSGGAVNILKGAIDLCLGTDGGGSVLAPALATNLPAFMGNGIGLRGGQGRSTDGIPFMAGLGVIGCTLDMVLEATELLYGTPIQNENHMQKVSVAIPAPGCMPMPDGEDCTAELRTYLEKLPSGNIQWDWQEIQYDTPYDRVALSRQLQQLIRENPHRLYLSLEGPIDVFSADETIPRSFAGCAPQIVAGTLSKAFVKVANPCGCSGFALPCDRLATGFVLLLPPGNEMLPAACVLAHRLMKAAPRPEMFERYFLRREKFCEAFSV